jgi:hypothetical protein
MPLLRRTPKIAAARRLSPPMALRTFGELPETGTTVAFLGSDVSSMAT